MLGTKRRVFAESKKSAHLSMPGKTISAPAADSVIAAFRPADSDPALAVARSESLTGGWGPHET